MYTRVSSLATDGKKATFKGTTLALACMGTQTGLRGGIRAWARPALSPLLSSQYIFTDAYAQYLWTTFDFCNTIQGFFYPIPAADLLLHCSKASNLLLGFDRSHPNKQVRELRNTVR